MAINPYQSVLPGTEGNVYTPPVPKINPYQSVIPGTTGNTLTVPPPATTTLSATNIGATPIQLPKTPTPIVPTMPAPLAPTEGGVQLTQNADGTASRAGAPPAPTPISIDQQATDFAQAQTPVETPAETQQTQLQSRFTQLYEKLFGKPQAQQQAETAQGIPQKSQAVADIQAQINQLQNDASAAMIKAQTMGETSSFGNAQIAQIERDRTVKALQLNSFLFAAQGNLLVAQDMADKAVKAQFEPAELEIEYLREFLAMNEKNMTREDKKKADALKIQLDERTRLLEEQKSEREAINAISIEAAQAGADAVMINRINSAPTQEEAVRIAASDPKLLSWAKRMQEEKFAEEKRQFGLTYNEQVRQFNAKQTADGGIDPAQLVAYGQQYASTGKIPTGIPKGSFGAIAAYAKELPKENGAIVDKNTGTAPDAAETLINGMASIYSAVDLAKQLKELDKKRIGGVVSGTLGKVFGSADQQRYVDLKQQIIDLLARARTGAAMTTSEEKFYGDMLPGRFSEPFGLGSNSDVRIDNFINNLSSDLQNKASTRGWAIQGLSTVNLDGQEYKVGDVITVNGVSGRVLADGSIALIQ